ncbi:protein Iojap-related, mitochondrial [Benincasa hispida]|uniref:protein Iojap-related, mitochondrial n=1 Tax=Benincasa hispida TaxID=102211 RepID=UPI0019012310|nr:protein Iojap-related, mitochondrial [Benincasa hispida]
MLAAQRIQSSSAFSSTIRSLQLWNRGVSVHNHALSSSTASSTNKGLLDLQEVETILNNVKADDVKVILVRKECDWADYMVFATGRSTWHVKNIAQALIYKVKQKQKGARQLVLPSVEGQEDGKWIVIDSGKVVVHALDENARSYYNLESLWSTETPQDDSSQDLDRAFVKIRPKNNSKKPAQKLLNR